MMGFKTTIEDGEFILDYSDHIKSIKLEVVRKLAGDIDMAVADTLVHLGWTPPPEVAAKMKKRSSDAN